MRMSRAVAAVGVAAAALSMVSAGVADAQQDIIGGSTVSSAPWGAQIYWNNVTTYGGFECSGTVSISGTHNLLGSKPKGAR